MAINSKKIAEIFCKFYNGRGGERGLWIFDENAKSMITVVIFSDHTPP